MSELEKLNAIEILSDSETAGTLQAKGVATPVKMDYTTELIIPTETIKKPKKKGKNENYEVTIQFGDGETYIGQETYSLKAYPPVKQNSLLAEFYRAEILQGLSLDRVVDGMISSADLINLAYWAFAARGTDDLLVDLHKLQMQLHAATDVANQTMIQFGTTSESVKNNLISAFDTFAEVDADTTPEDQLEQEALLELQKAADSGKKMAKQSKDLADKFGGIIKECSRIISQAIEKKVQDTTTKQELELRVLELNNLIDSTKTLQEQLVSAIDEAETRYQEAKEQEATERERGFITGLAGAIVGGLAGGVGMYLAMKTPGLPNAGGGANTGSKPTETNKPEATNTDTEDEDTSEKLKKANKALVKAKQAKEDNAKKIEEAEKIIAETTDANVKKKAQDTKDEANAKVGELDAAIEAAQKNLDNIVSLATNTTASFNQLSQNTYNAAAEASKQKMEFYRQKIKLAEENRKALADIVLYTGQVQYTGDAVTNIKTAIQSLEFAISALNRVVAALTETEQFWKSLAKFCEDKLGSTQFAEDVATMIKISTAEQRMNQYRDEAKFVLPAIQTIAYWVAVKKISNEYQNAVWATFQRIIKDIQTRPSQAEAQKGLAAKANLLLEDTKKEDRDMQMNIAFYEEQMLEYAAIYTMNQP